MSKTGTSRNSAMDFVISFKDQAEKYYTKLENLAKMLDSESGLDSWDQLQLDPGCANKNGDLQGIPITVKLHTMKG